MSTSESEQEAREQAARQAREAQAAQERAAYKLASASRKARALYATDQARATSESLQRESEQANSESDQAQAAQAAREQQARREYQYKPRKQDSILTRVQAVQARREQEQANSEHQHTRLVTPEERQEASGLLSPLLQPQGKPTGTIPYTLDQQAAQAWYASQEAPEEPSESQELQAYNAWLVADRERVQAAQEASESDQAINSTIINSLYQQESTNMSDQRTRIISVKATPATSYSESDQAIRHTSKLDLLREQAASLQEQYTICASCGRIMEEQEQDDSIKVKLSNSLQRAVYARLLNSERPAHQDTKILAFCSQYPCYNMPSKARLLQRNEPDFIALRATEKRAQELKKQQRASQATRRASERLEAAQYRLSLAQEAQEQAARHQRARENSEYQLTTFIQEATYSAPAAQAIYAALAVTLAPDQLQAVIQSLQATSQALQEQERESNRRAREGYSD